MNKSIRFLVIFLFLDLLLVTFLSQRAPLYAESFSNVGDEASVSLKKFLSPDLTEDTSFRERIEGLATSDGIGMNVKSSDSDSKKISEIKGLLGENLEFIKTKKKKIYIDGEVIIKYKKDFVDLKINNSEDKENIFLRDKGLEKKDKYDKDNISLLKITDGKTVEEKISDLKDNPAIEYIQPNYLYSPASIATNDPQRNLLWGLDNTGQTVNNFTGLSDKDIDAPEAWNRAAGSGVVIAVIDNGVAYNHPDLIGNMWDGTNCVNELGTVMGACIHGYDYELNDKDPFPNDYQEDTHGTHIAGTIAATGDNSVGIIGVAPDAKIMALKTDLSTLQLIKAINFAQQNNADIINASWGGPTQDATLLTAITNFSGMFIVAAGNGGNDSDPEGDNHDGGETLHDYPCDYTLANIICVAATDQNDNIASFSDFGTTSVDVGAPGTNILSTVKVKYEIDDDFNSTSLLNIPQYLTRYGSGNSWGVRSLNDSNGNVIMKLLYGDVYKPYSSYSNTWLLSPSYNLSGSQARISFNILCDTPASYGQRTDAMYVNFSGNGGEDWSGGSWWDEDTIANSEGSFRPSGFSQYIYYPDLKINIPSEDLTDQFKFVFGWLSDGYLNDYWGCAIGNLQFVRSGDYYFYSEGTSMAAPHVAGIVALVWSYRPNLSIAEVKGAILNSGDSIAALAGKTVTGKRVNAYNALVSVQGDIIDSFTFESGGVQFPCFVNERKKTITCSLPGDVPRTNLAPTISLTGGTISPASGVVNNFFENNTYTFTRTGGIQEVYTVNIVDYFRFSSSFRSGKGNWTVPSTRFLTSGDFNGDGKDEIAAMYDYGNSDMGILVFKPNGEAFTVSSWYRSGKGNWTVPSTRFLTSGDFDNDGKDEIAAMYDYGNNDMGILVFKPNGEAFTQSSWYRSGKGNWGVPNTRFVTSGDYTGDGKAKVAAMYDYGSNDMGIWVFGPNGTSFQSSLWYRSGKGNWTVPSTRFLTSGDYNGNGIDEIGAMYDYGSSDMGILKFR